MQPLLRHIAIQKHVIDHSQPAKKLVDKLKHLLAEGGFDLYQWASNIPGIISHLPAESRSGSSELLFTQDGMDPQERTVGLRWQCLSDTHNYKHGQMEKTEPTMHSIYWILASQYDPLGFISPFTTRAKAIVQKLWDKKRVG
ncbi:hypothetical protein AAFF_G00177160 [Aldrovandia affinis]|uniref:Uncharacterized protein n=1 Tax=Aldrovandia affinis TaxID=143900 RepID=A0AAD7RLG5_9TELE|nr:hypothetical protein AAFF_G00177160 [Aldrovandia affinis]